MKKIIIPGWDAYFALVRNLKWAVVESDELQYKRTAERYLRSVTNEVLSSKENWIDAARDRGNFRRYLNILGGGWKRMTYLAKWWDEEPERVAATLRDLWALHDGSSGELPSRDEVFTRIRRFNKELPFVDRNLRRPGGRLGLISALLIRISVEHYPPFKVTMFTTAYELTNYPKPPDDADEATLYKHVGVSRQVRRGSSGTWTRMAEQPPRSRVGSPHAPSYCHVRESALVQ